MGARGNLWSGAPNYEEASKSPASLAPVPRGAPAGTTDSSGEKQHREGTGRL